MKKLSKKIRESRPRERRHHRDEFPKGELPPRGELRFDKERAMKEGRPPHGEHPRRRPPHGPKED